jgi:hypothetical protein
MSDPTTVCPFCNREHDTPELLELQSRLDRWVKAAKADGYPCDEPGCFQEVCQLARGNYDYVAPPDEPVVENRDHKSERKTFRDPAKTAVERPVCNSPWHELGAYHEGGTYPNCGRA